MSKHTAGAKVISKTKDGSETATGSDWSRKRIENELCIKNKIKWRTSKINTLSTFLSEREEKYTTITRQLLSDRTLGKTKDNLR